MTFEEFFKKKKIELPALEKAEPALFFEFKTHFEQMGEKSFDHSKKFWFNKLRRQFPAVPDLKVEKVIIENPIAEQTIVESLTDSQNSVPSPKPGFTPRFKANIQQPAEKIAGLPLPPAEKADNVDAKPAYQPRFKAKPVVEVEQPVEETATATGEEQKNPSASDNTVAKPGYQPRFKMKAKTETTIQNEPDEQAPAPELPGKSESELPKPAYKPRFKAPNNKPKTDD